MMNDRQPGPSSFRRLRPAAGFFSTSWPSGLLVFALAFTIRLGELLEIPRRLLIPRPSWELDSIAISLVETGQFADPYLIPTGPTAHLPPLYPWLVSLIYRSFGLTELGGFIRYLVIVLMASLMFGLLPWLGHRLGVGRPAGLVGGLIGALSVQWGGHGEFLTGIGLGLLLVVFLKRWSQPAFTSTGSILLGILCGILLLLQPALLAVIIGCLAFELWWSRSRPKFFQSALVALGILLAAFPWTWRNYQVFGELTFIRSNFGLELNMGNHPGASATMEVMDELGAYPHPRTHFSEAELLRDVGEIEYMRLARDQALVWIWGHPGEFLWLALQRWANLWFGPLHRPAGMPVVSICTLLAIWGLVSAWPGLAPQQRAATLIPLITYPAVYYLMAYMPRYRIPLDGMIYLLSGAGMLSLLGTLSRSFRAHRLATDHESTSA